MWSIFIYVRAETAEVYKCVSGLRKPSSLTGW